MSGPDCLLDEVGTEFFPWVRLIKAMSLVVCEKQFWPGCKWCPDGGRAAMVRESVLSGPKPRAML